MAMSSQVPALRERRLNGRPALQGGLSQLPCFAKENVSVAMPWGRLAQVPLPEGWVVSIALPLGTGLSIALPQKGIDWPAVGEGRLNCPAL